MKQTLIMAMQRTLAGAGFYRGDIDGAFFTKSIAALQSYLRSLDRGKNRWPGTSQAELLDFYGKPGDESRLITIPFPFPMLYEGKPAIRTRCHERVAPSLLRVLSDIGDHFALDSSVRDAAGDYGGVYNDRPMRGGSTPSLHARGAAIDLDADDNGNLDPWPAKADMPLEVMEAFAREGWTSAGAFWGRDAMHFQATRMPTT